MANRSRADVRHAIDLLWIHQIRRENARLYQEVQQLQGAVKNFAEEQATLREFSRNAKHNAAEAVATVQPTLSSIQTIQAKLEQTATLAEAASKQISDLPSRFENVQKDWQSSIADLDLRIGANNASVQKLQGQYDEAVASLSAKFDEASRAIETKVEEQSLEELHLRVHALENRFMQPSHAGVPSHISESIEPADVTYELSVVDSRDGLEQQKSDCETATEEEEYMLTMRDLEPRDSTSIEFDLDANVTVPSYSLHASRPSPIRDSLQPIAPACSSNAQLRAAILALKQGRYHSHDRYLAEGQSLMDRLPEEHERFLVENFVKGLYSSDEREKCHQFLQLHGWRWETILSLLLPGTPPAHTYMHADKVTESVNTRHSRTRDQMPSPEKPATLQSQLAEAARPQEEAFPAPDLPRRSTRIAASQHPYRDTLQKADRSPSHTVRKVAEHQGQRGNSASGSRKKGPQLQRPLLAASSIRKPASIVSIELGNGPRSPSQPGGFSSIRIESIRKGVPSRGQAPTTPERSISAVATSRRTQPRANQKKRKGPDDWLTTESHSDGSTDSDEVQLPNNPSPELGGRKRRRKVRRRVRAVARPPPEIPILSTSE